MEHQEHFECVGGRGWSVVKFRVEWAKAVRGKMLKSKIRPRPTRTNTHIQELVAKVTISTIIPMLVAFKNIPKGWAEQAHLCYLSNSIENTLQAKDRDYQLSPSETVALSYWSLYQF